jgi:molybdopterin/thiamine biosynthesis adenylyltransferase
MTLDDDTIERFSRQLILHEVGPDGQQRLAASRVLFIGLEPAVTTAAVYVAGAGTGHVGLADSGTVTADDLDAALVFGSADIGELRRDAVAATIHRSGAPIACEPFEATRAAVVDRHWDLLVCGTRDGPLLKACNEAAITAGIPAIVVHSSARPGWVAGVAGHSPAFPCWHCMSLAYPADVGIARAPGTSVAAGVLGTIAATESLKLLLDIGAPIHGRRIVHDDTVVPGIQASTVAKAPDCQTCRGHRAARPASGS